MEPRKELAETLELQDTGPLVDRAVARDYKIRWTNLLPVLLHDSHVLNVSHMDARTVQHQQDPKSLHQLNGDVATPLDTSSQLHKSSHQVKLADAGLLANGSYVSI